MKKEPPWNEIYNFVLENGNIRVPKDFCTHFVEKVDNLLPYDQARIYFLNDNQMVADTVLYEADPKWMEQYFEYYSELEEGRYSLTRGMPYNININLHTFDWEEARSNEFIADYIQPQGIRHSLSAFFHDETNAVNVICTFERTTHSGYAEEEIATLGMLHAQLDNLYKNLIYVPEQGPAIEADHRRLTKREREIMHLIRRGAKPSSAAKKLGISPATVYKHIANIYKKLNISSMQELMLLQVN